MPELPEVEAWRRSLNDPVSAFPVEKAGPAHIATLKTFDPPLSTLEGRRFAGVERRAKRLLFPTDDGELQLRIHLMSAGRVRHLVPGAKGPKTPAFRLRFENGCELVLTEAGSKKRAGVWLETPEQTEAMEVEPLDSITSLDTRMAYGKSSSEGTTGATERSASAPWPISRRFCPPKRPVSPTLKGGKL